MDTTQNPIGPGMGNTVGGSTPKKSSGLVTAIIVIVLVIVALLFLTSKAPSDEMMGGDEVMIEGSADLDDTTTQEAEATANLNTGDELTDLEADLSTVETTDLE